MKPIEFTAKVEGIQDYFAGKEISTRKLKLKAPKGIKLNFEAGQFLMIAVDEVKHPANPELLKWSAMSICSTEKMLPNIELIISIMKTPGLTNYIGHKIKVGDEVKIKAPFGVFTLKPEDKKRIFVATGTGLAPMMSYLRKMDETKFLDSTLFFGFKTETVFLFKEELEALKKKRKNFDLQSIASEPSSGSNVKKGFVQELINKYSFTEPKDDYGIYICGNPAMCEQVKELLLSLGFKRIFFEKY